MASLAGSIQVTVRLEKLEAMKNGLGPKAEALLDVAAAHIEGMAKQMAPYKTGALRNSIKPEKDKPFSRRIGDGVEYGIYQEFGTSRMGAQPFMVPALERERPVFLRGWEALFK